MRIFVTGAAGFIGSAVVRELVTAGHTVTGLVRSAHAVAAVERMGARACRGTIEDPDILCREAALADGVIHTAFFHALSHASLGIRARILFGGAPTRIVERFAAAAVGVDQRAIETFGKALGRRKGSLVIAFPTMAMAAGRPAQETDDADRAAVGGARARSEQAALDLVRTGVNATVVRLPPSVHDETRLGLVTRLIEIARKKRMSACPADGLNRWAAVHRLDASRLFRLALENGEPGARYHGAAMESAQRAAALAPALPGTPSARLVDDAALMKRLWTVRETGASATSIGRRVEVRSGRGLGRRRRGAAPSRCVSARILDACGSVRLQNQFVRPLRRWLHSRTDHLRSTSRAGLEDVSPSGCVEPVRVRRSPQARHVRARLLFELLKGEVIEDGWQSEAVKDSLDHCLACKGCRGDCPTHVSGVANALMRNPSFRKMSAKSGLAEDVKFPVIAAKTFRNGASAKRLLTQPESATSGTTKPTPVLLWTDTFNNGFTPDVMEAAVEEQVAPK